MALTVSAAFNQLIRQLPPTESEVSDAASHRQSIQDCLRNNFGLDEYFRIGSYERTTSVSGYSDVDIMAVLPQSVAYGITPNTFITKVRDALQRRFPYTLIRIDRQAVVLQFSQGKRAVDLVPAVYSSTHNGYKTYRIANSGSWLYTSPRAHNAYFSNIDHKCSDTMRALARLLKAWKYYNAAPILSFHMDMLTAYCARNGGSISYAHGTKVMLSNLLSRNLAALQDPVGVAGLIPACSSETNKQTALGKLRSAVDHADRARAAEQRGDIKEAFSQWDMVFAYRFPAYG
ncbi:MAG: nucleotidyltransferase [Chloroflexi bacterium]|nr:nucleotidyltransferase [Chloroflexota bacterium]